MSEATAVLDELSTSDCLAFYRKLAAGVTVVTAAGESGPVGATASSVTSVSLRPPLLLACLSTGSRTMAAIRSRRAFAVHLLAEEQRHLSVAFAAHTEDRFAERRVANRPRRASADRGHSLGVCRLADPRHYGDHESPWDNSSPPTAAPAALDLA